MATYVWVDDEPWQAMLESVNKLGGTQVRVGVLGNDVDRPHPERPDITMGEVMLIQELGTLDGHVPARRPLASTFEDHAAEFAEISERVAEQVILRGVSAHEAMDRAGALGAELVQRQILDRHIRPPNAPATVEKKGQDFPLVDSGHLVEAITHAVVHEETEYYEESVFIEALEGEDYESITVEGPL